MADLKISALPSASTPLVGTEILPLVQSGVTDKVTVANLTAGRAISALRLNVAVPATNGVQFLDVTGGTTTSSFGRVKNTGADAVFGIENSAGAGILSGSTAYATVIYTVNATQLEFGTNSARKAYLTSGGDFGVTAGNIIPGTAAKGINFTANTPAAGMTSQLLNWYEEGTWTPVVSSGTGAITTVGAVVGRYTRIGRQVTIIFTATITTNGTGASYILITGMPYAPDSNLSSYSGMGTNSSTGKGLAIATSSTNIFVRYYDATYPVADAQSLRGTIVYNV